jgi:cytochrome c biogenesis protein CcmG/thiol:disulfide interchange protein DsbE
LVIVLGLLVVATTTPTKKAVFLPAITFTTAKGEKVKSPWGTVAHPGRATVIVFFASWCEPCKEELPALSRYLNAHGSRAVAVFGLDGREDHPADGITFAERAGFRNTVVVDPTYDLVSGLFNLPGFPDTVFIGADGELIERHIGPLTAREFATRYEALVER